MIHKSVSVILLLGILVGCAGTSVQSSIPTVPAATPTSKLPLRNAEPLPIGDGGLISDKPCASPCFFEVRMGETQLANVAPILGDSGISPCYDFNESVIVCGEGVFTIIVGADPVTRIVDGITYYPSAPVSIGDVIKKYGEPNHTWVQLEGTPEDPSMTMFLLWDPMKMRIDLHEDSSNVVEKAFTIESETKIWSVSYMNSSEYSNLFNNSFAKPWKGYGDYLP